MTGSEPLLVCADLRKRYKERTAVDGVSFPHAWFLRGVGEASAGGSITAWGGSAAVVALVGLVCGGLGLSRMRRLVLG